MDPLKYGLEESEYWFLTGEILVSKQAVQQSYSESKNTSLFSRDASSIDLIILINLWMW